MNTTTTRFHRSTLLALAALLALQAEGQTPRNGGKTGSTSAGIEWSGTLADYFAPGWSTDAIVAIEDARTMKLPLLVLYTRAGCAGCSGFSRWVKGGHLDPLLRRAALLETDPRSFDLKISSNGTRIPSGFFDLFNVSKEVPELVLFDVVGDRLRVRGRVSGRRSPSQVRAALAELLSEGDESGPDLPSLAGELLPD